MKGFFDAISGYKTYITAISAFVFNLGSILHWWTLDNQVWAEINTLFGTFGLAFLRSAMKSNNIPTS